MKYVSLFAHFVTHSLTAFHAYLGVSILFSEPSLSPRNNNVMNSIRNPVDRSYSSYLHLRLRNKVEGKSFIESFYSKGIKNDSWQRRLWHDEGSTYADGIFAYTQEFDVKIAA